MISLARIFFADSDPHSSLTRIGWQLRNRLSLEVVDHKWVGYTMVVPQLLIQTQPTAITLQTEHESQWVQPEVDELIHQLSNCYPKMDFHALAACNTIIDLMSADEQIPTVTDGSITVTAQTEIDLQTRDIQTVLAAVRDITGGHLLDCVEDRFQTHGSKEPLDLAQHRGSPGTSLTDHSTEGG